MADTDQRPVEIILARGLMATLTTPAFLIDTNGTLVFFNEAAGEILGLRYEDAGPMRPHEWGTRFTPTTPDGQELAIEDLPIAIALNEERPAHSVFSIRAASGEEQEIAVSAFPIMGTGGIRGAMAIFWTR